MDTLMCFSYSCSSVPMDTQKLLQYSNKILLPESMLRKVNQMDDVEYPLFFKITNPVCGLDRVCAVHEFTAAEGLINIPYYILEDLGLTEGSGIDVEYINPPTGSYVKIKPHKTAFIELNDPKAILETIMSRDYPVITKGQTIIINYEEKAYRIDIVDTKPCEIIKIINTDVLLDFDQPHDYVEPIKTKPSSQNNLNVFKQTGQFIPFSGNGNRLGSV